MLKIRRPLGRLIFNMGIAIPGKTVFLIETAPSTCKTSQFRYSVNSYLTLLVLRPDYMASSRPIQCLQISWISRRRQVINSHIIFCAERRVIAFNEKGFKLPGQSQIWEMIENVNACLYILLTFSTSRADSMTIIPNGHTFIKWLNIGKGQTKIF